MSKTVLIVEDEIFVAMDIERILSDAGFTVTAIAADRETALATPVTPDLAFIDINLRDGRTGPLVANDLAAHGTKVFYVTANPAQIDPIAPTAIGYIRKPFSADAIRSAALLGANDAGGMPAHAEITLLRGGA
ncbi:MAG TPA: response regulator [Sphingomicrobium sp.]|nr:response regulator [Sphingomicrobium sp.]